MFTDELLTICKRVLQRYSDKIEALNKSQLLKGEKSDSSFLPAYKKSYLKTRRKFGRPTAPMDLYLTGEFHKGIFATFFDRSFNLQSDDHKSDLLEDRFGSKIFGLTDKSKDELLSDGVKDAIINEAKPVALNYILTKFRK